MPEQETRPVWSSTTTRTASSASAPGNVETCSTVSSLTTGHLPGHDVWGEHNGVR